MVSTISCARCGTTLPSDAKFCAACGVRVQDASATGWVPAPPTREYVEYRPKFVYAGFWLRFVAFIIDTIVVNVAIAVIGMAVGNKGEDGLSLSGALNLFGNWLYFALLEAGPWQATVGKKVLGLVVVDGRGNPISFGRATGRYFGKVISALTVLIGFLMAGFTTRKQALHDIMAGALVVQRPTGFART